MGNKKEKKLILPRISVTINQKAPVFTDRKKEANKAACRKKNWEDKEW